MLLCLNFKPSLSRIICYSYLILSIPLLFLSIFAHKVSGLINRMVLNFLVFLKEDQLENDDIVQIHITQNVNGGGVHHIGGPNDDVNLDSDQDLDQGSQSDSQVEYGQTGQAIGNEFFAGGG